MKRPEELSPSLLPDETDRVAEVCILAAGRSVHVAVPALVVLRASGLGAGDEVGVCERSVCEHDLDPHEVTTHASEAIFQGHRVEEVVSLEEQANGAVREVVGVQPEGGRADYGLSGSRQGGASARRVGASLIRSTRVGAGSDREGALTEGLEGSVTAGGVTRECDRQLGDVHDPGADKGVVRVARTGKVLQL